MVDSKDHGTQGMRRAHHSLSQTPKHHQVVHGSSSNSLHSSHKGLRNKNPSTCKIDLHQKLMVGDPWDVVIYESMMRQIEIFVMENRRLPRFKEWKKCFIPGTVKKGWIKNMFGRFKQMLRDTGWERRIICMYRNYFIQKYNRPPTYQDWVRYSARYNIPDVAKVSDVFGSFATMNSHASKDVPPLQPIERKSFIQKKKKMLFNAARACLRLKSIPPPIAWNEHRKKAKIVYMPTKQYIYFFYDSWKEFVDDLTVSLELLKSKEKRIVKCRIKNEME